ncbi:MAG: preprotein translocase subunit SecG [Rhodospirillales bacterium]|jgi:preprotein translocase subunit SecG|nr:preprotein translocase subunit SecG [Rhodospirillales bacterium]MDP7100538.1 preprotein translocase subunit SecG [Rhodospirillales bacterium]MDP7625373.1 preprotein translocase subunit SecG [Rhodospirillales bacterium]HJO86946.1 preprotein translocase subunit SecG [Rhodospirillales bacterium]|tara:strand:+ start:41 stop:382 length:342 start_codon:yes stop_codon:yes gene_type:complete
METVIIVIHLLLAIAMIFLVLIQQSEGGLGGMGGGASGGGMGGFMTGRATANLLTRSTGILATAFFVTSMALAILADQGREKGSILDQPAKPANQTQTPATPSVPSVPTVPGK